MKSVIFNTVAALLFTSVTFTAATPITGPICDIACIKPSEHDPFAESPSCNCAAKFCPPGLECPAYTSNGFNSTSGQCGCTAFGHECDGLDVECVAGFKYGWNLLDSTCQCLPILPYTGTVTAS